MMLIVVINALILVGLILALRGNDKLVNEMLKFQLVTSSHVEELCKEVADLVQRVDELEAQAKKQGWPYDPTKK
jgi:cell division protein FtsB